MGKWNSDIVIQELKKLSETELSYKSLKYKHQDLYGACISIFGSRTDAIMAAGLNGRYLEAKDGSCHSTVLKKIIANKLIDLKLTNQIQDVFCNYLLPSGKTLRADFCLMLNNGTKLWLEVNQVENKLLNDKVNLYRDFNLPFFILNKSEEVEKVVLQYITDFKIPIKNSLITAHSNPDGDAIASSVAMFNYIKSFGKKAAIKLKGDVPKNLEWMLESVDVVSSVPDWVDQIIVLDCAPTKERVGWNIPNKDIFNIDHHDFRLIDNSPQNNTHVIHCCSTAGILLSRFGIVDKILAVGIYTDTLFTKNIHEAFYYLDELGITSDEIDAFLLKINQGCDKKVLSVIRNCKIHRCRNGFIIAEISESSPDILEPVVQILSKISESVCLIYGKEKNVKLRTNNPDIDLSIIAKEFSGGGHKYAAVCSANGCVKEFKNKIVSYSKEN